MAVIHLTGSIALFIFGGFLVFFNASSMHTAIGWQEMCDSSKYVCELDITENLVMLLIGIGLISGGVAVAKAASKPTQEKLEEQDERGFDWMSDDKYGSLEDYERDYLARQGIKSTKRKPTARRKPAKTRESENNFCDNCGKSLRPTAKFCGSCGTSVP